MKKKTVKMAGVAVMSMAMLLSMGALAMPVSAAGTALAENSKITLNDTAIVVKGATQGKYTLYKVADAIKGNDGSINYSIASQYADVLHLKSGLVSTKAVITDGDLTIPKHTALKTMTGHSAQIEAVAKKLMAKASDATKVSEATIEGTTTSTTLDVTVAGYYLILGDTNAMTQPILVSILPDENIAPVSVKNAEIPFTKAITKITNANSTNNLIGTDNENNAGGTGISEKNGVVQYTLSSVFPKYDTDVTALADDYTITDIPEDSILIQNDTIKVYVNDSTVATNATEGEDTNFTLTTGVTKAGLEATTTKLGLTKDGKFVDTVTTDGTGFQIVFDDAFVIAHRGQKVEVVFDAKVAENPDVDTNSNDNGATLSYSNNYFTGKGRIADEKGPDDSDEPDGKPEEYPDEPKVVPDDAKIYTSMITINKEDPDGIALKGAVFGLYNGETLIQQIGSAAAEIEDPDNPGQMIANPAYVSTFTFSGLGDGTYTLREITAPDGYSTVADSTVTITANKDATVAAMYAGSFDKTNNGTVTIVDQPTQSLPGTGGIGTYLFTIGGAAIVLLAGVLFVIYMKKRASEE